MIGAQRNFTFQGSETSDKMPMSLSDTSAVRKNVTNAPVMRKPYGMPDEICSIASGVMRRSIERRGDASGLTRATLPQRASPRAARGERRPSQSDPFRAKRARRRVHAAQNGSGGVGGGGG